MADGLPLPPGWAIGRTAGPNPRIYYIDHATKRTQWTKPTSSPGFVRPPPPPAGLTRPASRPSQLNLFSAPAASALRVPKLLSETLGGSSEGGEGRGEGQPQSGLDAGYFSSDTEEAGIPALEALFVTVKCRSLLKMQSMSKSDPVTLLYKERDVGSGSFDYVGQTERLRNSHDPNFEHVLRLSATPGQGHVFRFAVFQEDTPGQSLKFRTGADYKHMIGECRVNFDTLLESGDRNLAFDLEHPSVKRQTELKNKGSMLILCVPYTTYPKRLKDYRRVKRRERRTQYVLSRNRQLAAAGSQLPPSPFPSGWNTVRSQMLPSMRKTTLTRAPSTPELQKMWSCAHCTLVQKPQAKCEACGMDRKDAPTIARLSMSSRSRQGSVLESKWVCGTCTLVNTASASNCMVCDTERPKGSKQSGPNTEAVAAMARAEAQKGAGRLAYRHVLKSVVKDGRIPTEQEEQLAELIKAFGITKHEQEELLAEVGTTLHEFNRMKEVSRQEKAKQEQVQLSECVVCLDEVASHVVFDCMHLCLCEDCANCILATENPTCPNCRAEAKKIAKIFK